MFIFRHSWHGWSTPRSVFFLCWLITGCGGWEFDIPGLPLPEGQPDRGTLESLSGQSESDVLSQLGKPKYIWRLAEETHFVYEHSVWVKVIAKAAVPYAFPFPIIVPARGHSRRSAVYCAALTFRHGVLSHFETGHDIEAPFECHAVFWSPGELAAMTSVEVQDHIPLLLRQEAERGDPDAQYQRYLYDSSLSDLEEWQMLCRAADEGHEYSQLEIAHHYWNGIAPVHENRIKGFAWYRLAQLNKSTRGSEEVRLSREMMTPAQIAEAERMVTEWKPGQCEAELKGAAAKIR